MILFAWFFLNINKKLKKGAYMKKKITFISLIIICVIMFLITTLCPFYKVEGKSMSPTLKNNDYVCIKKTKSFKQGDLIAFEYNNKLLVRRVIALSNDEVNIDTNGYVFVNDKKLEEDYLTSRKDNPLRDEVFPYTVHNGKVFKKLFIKRSRIGFKFGEFSLTKKFTKKQEKIKSKKKTK